MAVKPRDVHLFFRKTATFVKYKEIQRNKIYDITCELPGSFTACPAV